MPLSPRTLRPSSTFTPKSISGLALWLDGSDANSLYTTDAGAVTAVSSPTEISGCVGWWDSADLSSMRQNSDGTGTVAAGDPVGWWLDKSATGATVTGSGSARPTLSATGFNSRQALVFNGSSTNLSNAAYTATNSLSGMTRIAVCANTTNTTGALSRVFSGGSDFFMQMNGNARLYVSSAANFLGVSLSSNSNIAPAGLYADVFSNSAISFYSSGAGLAGTVTGTIPATTGGGTPAIHIGSNVGANLFWNGPIAEYIIFNRALTRAELASVESYLAAKWGISGVHVPATAASDPVGYWGDKSGNARHATQSTAAKRPLVGTQNNRKALTFDGSDDNVSLTPSSPIGSSAFTAIAAIKHNLTSQPLYLAPPLSLTAGNQGRPLERWQGGSSQSIVTIGAVTSNVGGSYRSFSDRFVYGLDALKDGISSGTHQVREYINGAINFDTSNNGSWTTSSQRVNVGSRDDNGTQYKGDICELCVYDRRLSASERQRLERYLAARWNITLAPQVSNADAQDWVNRVYANGGTVTSATASAVNTFCDAIDAAGIRDRFYRMGIFAGSNLNAAFVPLYRGPSLGGAQYGKVTDENNGPFVSGDFTSDGLLGAAGKFLKTGLSPDTVGVATGHMSLIAKGAASSAQALAIGARNSGASQRYVISTANRNAYQGDANTDFYSEGNWGGSSALVYQSTGSAARPSGQYLVTRTASNRIDWYLNGQSVANSQSSVTPGATSNEFYVMGINNNESAFFFGATVCRGYSIGLSLTAAQALAFSQAAADFNTAIGRT